MGDPQCTKIGTVANPTSWKLANIVFFSVDKFMTPTIRVVGFPGSLLNQELFHADGFYHQSHYPYQIAKSVVAVTCVPSGPCSLKALNFVF